MNHLTKLFRFLQLTRAQNQYGYILSEIPKSDLSDLAQHHYLVTAFAWQLGRYVQRQGHTINMERVLEICIMHDLGEVFGGDIAMPYAKANPAANKLAKEFEAENLRFIGTLFGDDQAHFSELTKEAATYTSAEGVVAKIADYVECTHYKLYMRRLTPGDVDMIIQRLHDIVNKLEDTALATTLHDFLDMWKQEVSIENQPELFEQFKA